MSGNRTLVTRVTGGYTHHYTNADLLICPQQDLPYKVITVFLLRLQVEAKWSKMRDDRGEKLTHFNLKQLKFFKLT